MSEIKSLEKLRSRILLKDIFVRGERMSDNDEAYKRANGYANKLADEIEAEIAEKYMELPVDADGVPIHVGDMLKNAESGRYSWLKNGSKSDSRKIEAKLGEPTNGIEDGSPLVDRDPVEIMRSCSDMEHGMGSLRKVLGIECVSGWQMRCLKVLADMVERDYARRDAVNAEIAKLIAKRDEALEIRDKALGDAATFKYERDEWKTKCETREFAYKQADAERKRYSEQIDELRAERDEWKAKAEQAELRSNDRVTNLEWLWENDRDALIDGITCNSPLCDECMFGKPGDDTYCAINEREWLMAPHVDAQRDSNGTCPNSDETCPNDVDSREKLEADVRYRSIRPTTKIDCHYDDVLRWLDRQAAITANETNHDNPYVGLVRGKQWKRTEISDYYCGRCGWKVTDHDSYCPECGGALHKASNEPDSESDARKTAETPETNAARGEICDFDDSREKLEADCTAAWKSVERIVRSGGMPKERWTNSEFFNLLDRQAAITEREIAARNLANWRKWCEEMGIQCTKERVGEQIAELQRERDDLKAQIDEILAGDKATDAINAELVAKVADLERECDDLHSRIEQWMNAAGNAHDMWEKADARRVEAERRANALSEKLSRAYGNAHDTLRMMDEELV